MSCLSPHYLSGRAYNAAVALGALTIRTPDSVTTARAGELIFLTAGTALSYEAGQDDT